MMNLFSRTRSRPTKTPDVFCFRILFHRRESSETPQLSRPRGYSSSRASRVSKIAISRHDDQPLILLPRIMIDITRWNRDAEDSSLSSGLCGGLQSQETRQKGRVAKREEGVKGLEAGRVKRGPGEADGVRRRAEDKAGGIKRARPSVWTHESPDITTCRRVHDVPFYGRTHTTQVSLPPPPPSSVPPALPTPTTAWWTRLVRSSGSRTVPRLGYSDVMWSCFYKTAFLQRRTSFVMAARFSFTPDPLVDYHPHFMPASSHKNTSIDVPLHPTGSTSYARFG